MWFQFIIQHVNGKQLRFNSEPGVPIKEGVIKMIPNYGMIRIIILEIYVLNLI